MNKILIAQNIITKGLFVIKTLKEQNALGELLTKEELEEFDSVVEREMTKLGLMQIELNEKGDLVK